MPPLLGRLFMPPLLGRLFMPPLLGRRPLKLPLPLEPILRGPLL